MSGILFYMKNVDIYTIVEVSSFANIYMDEEKTYKLTRNTSGGP